MNDMDSRIVIRRGVPGDARACNRVMHEAIIEFERLHGETIDEPEEEWWAVLEPFYRMLVANAAEWWVAEESPGGPLVGFARSIENDGVIELTEFFVRPSAQGHGLGRELIERAFPTGRGRLRFLIATRDVRAIARYYSAGLAIRFPILELSGPTSATEPPAGLAVERVDGEADRDAIRTIERALLGFSQGDALLDCLLDVREGYLYRRGGAAIGFAFVSRDGCGPIGALDPADLPDILLHVEGRAHELGMDRLDLEIPAPNAAATRHLIGRGFRLDQAVSFLMSDHPFGEFDRFIGFNPPLFL
jgi:GNAT superfamily N-acetyltransferase